VNIMRRTILALIVTLAAAWPAAAQAPADNPYGLDPYKPSDAALLRAFGTTLISQTPLPELATLDPYKPSHAALLRQMGGGLPLWGLAWYPLQTAGPVMPLVRIARAADPTPEPLARHEPRVIRHEALEESPPPAFWMATLQRPETNDGIWIPYAGRQWIAAGKAIPFDASAFERVGSYGSFTAYKRTRPADDLIYVPTRDGLVAPYRAKTMP
jgi:hypothetical protein